MAQPGSSLTLRPRRTGTLVGLGTLAVVTFLFLAGALFVHHLVWLLFAVSLCALGVVGVAALPGRSHLRLTPAGFEIRTAFRERSFAWQDVTPFVAARLSQGGVVIFRARQMPAGALPPTPKPTAKALADGADALPATRGRDATALAALMNDWRTRALAS